MHKHLDISVDPLSIHEHDLPPCFLHLLQLFVEYVTNDGYHHGSVDNSLVRSFERLLRKLLGFRHSPAVVLMEFLATDVKTSNLPFYATGR
jgi:hypothetical protein